MTLAEARTKFPPIWTIYNQPTDFPSSIVVRVWYGETCEPDATLFNMDNCEDALRAARHYVQRRGASVPLPRDPSDMPCIVESWI